MQFDSSIFFSWLRRLSLATIAGIFLVSNLSAADQLVSPAGAYAAKASISLQLHSSPHFQGSAHGLRESSPEEVQRIEELGARQKFSRLDSLNDLISQGQASAFPAAACGKPLLLLEIACCQANLISFAHAYLTARYPIPPPTTFL